MSSHFSRLEIREIAKYHKLLLWSILVAIIANLCYVALRNQPHLFIIYLLVIYLPVAAFQIFVLFRLGRSLKLAAIWLGLCVIGLLIPQPLLNLLILLILHDKAMKAMKAAGLKVGFMGADLTSI